MHTEQLQKLDLYHVFQPIIDLETNEAFGYEMLLRSDEMGTPDKIFKWAEEHNKLFDLDMHSVTIAFHTIHEQISYFDGLHVFINILPTTVENPSSLANLKKLKPLLQSHAQRIVFEITEDKKGAELAARKAMVGNMKKQGFLIALDDLGKGDSTLPNVIELEPNIIKLDRYFADDLTNNIRKQRAIELINQFAGDEAIVILEGLETKEDVTTAKKLGVKYGQGFVLGRPQPLDYYFQES